MTRSAATADIAGLRARSVEVIRAGQAPTGAYLACPAFAPYRYSWFRDGAWIAEATSAAGERDSADAFFAWCADVVLARRARVEAGGDLDTRYTADGREGEEEWQSFQLDGFGLVLWALARHEERHGAAPPRVREAAEVLRAYLVRSWRRPCSDWWEEREGLHAVTLACIAAGLRAAGEGEAERVEAAIRSDADLRLDASLLAASAPLEVLAPDEVPLAEIERRLVSPGGGPQRSTHSSYRSGWRRWSCDCSGSAPSGVAWAAIQSRRERAASTRPSRSSCRPRNAVRRSHSPPP